LWAKQVGSRRYNGIYRCLQTKMHLCRSKLRGSQTGNVGYQRKEQLVPRKTNRGSCLLLLAAAGTFAVALPGRSGDDGVSIKNSKPAQVANSQVVKLYGITWHKSLDSALQAVADPHPARPIFLLTTLGDLAGKT
jgi:hypothetical protein